MNTTYFKRILGCLKEGKAGFLERETTFIGKQRLLTLVCYSFLQIIGTLVNFAEISGPLDDVLWVINITYLLLCVLFSVSYFFKKIKIDIAVIMLNYVTFLVISGEMIYTSYIDNEYNHMIVLGDMVLLYVNALFSCVAYFRISSFILSFASLGVYIFCSINARSESLQSFILAFATCSFFIGLLSYWLGKSVANLSKENTELKADERELFYMLRMKKDQVKAYLELASKDHDYDSARYFLELFDERGQCNLINNVKRYIVQKSSELVRLQALFPDLTHSELEICRLIVQGKKLGDIARLLNKSTSNINTQRSNIRRKLELTAEDNLCDFIVSKIKEVEKN